MYTYIYYISNSNSYNKKNVDMYVLVQIEDILCFII